jgi:hypothetical protein
MMSMQQAPQQFYNSDYPLQASEQQQQQQQMMNPAQQFEARFQLALREQYHYYPDKFAEIMGSASDTSPCVPKKNEYAFDMRFKPSSAPVMQQNNGTTTRTITADGQAQILWALSAKNRKMLDLGDNTLLGRLAIRVDCSNVPVKMAFSVNLVESTTLHETEAGKAHWCNFVVPARTSSAEIVLYENPSIYDCKDARSMKRWTREEIEKTFEFGTRNVDELRQCPLNPVFAFMRACGHTTMAPHTWEDILAKCALTNLPAVQTVAADNYMRSREAMLAQQAEEPVNMHTNFANFQIGAVRADGKEWSDPPSAIEDLADGPRKTSLLSHFLECSAPISVSLIIEHGKDA